MSQTPSNAVNMQPAAAKFDPSADHQARPKLRPIRGFPVQAQDQSGKTMVMLGLADARQISDKVVFTVTGAQLILPKMDGTRTLDQITTEVGQGLTRDVVEHLVAQLDDAGLIEGPVFEALHKKMREEFDAQPILPPASTAAFTDHLVAQQFGQNATDEQKAEHGPRLLREALDRYIAEALKEAQKPALDALPKAIVAPHLDYPRGWHNYASIYGRLRGPGIDRPDRIVILGTNHFGSSTGIAACDKGFSSPLGVCEVDRSLLENLKRRLGDRLVDHRYDHEREHSIELQIPWIQHIFGQSPSGAYPTVLGILVHDPAVNNGESYDGNGIGLQAFVDALKAAIQGLHGKTLIIASADLSHVGPGFGDQHPLAGDKPETVQFRDGVIRHDQEMLELVRQNKPSELIAAMAWQQNPTRWCSTGNLVATLLTVEPAEIELLNYGGAMDQQGIQLVTSAAMAMR